MKKFKLIFAALVCVFVMCPLFAGCATVGASYIKGSSKCTSSLDFIGSSYSYDFDYSFKVDVKKNGDYIVKFDLEIYSGETVKENLLKTINTSKNFSSEGNEICTVTGMQSAYFNNEISNLKVVISKIKIIREKDSNDLTAYAIGFGVAGGALLCGITVYFIVDKLVLSKKKDN